MRAALAACFLSLAAPLAAGDFVLGLPLDCELGNTCYIQRYVDRDPGPGVRDYRCGTLAGDGHKGTDFALPTLKDMDAGVSVLSSASGRVKAVRDGMPDRMFSNRDRAALAGRECGNGVVLAHEDGWETQYCHLKQGSVTVREGEWVKQGDILGQTGLSGLTNFPHVHLSVRRHGVEVDPFLPASEEGCDEPSQSLWADTPEYSAGGLVYAGFSDRIPTYEEVTGGELAGDELGPASDALVLFALAYGAQAGDVMQITIRGPAGMVITTDIKIEDAKPRLFRAAGKRLTQTAWPAGTYDGSVTMIRGAVELDHLAVQIDLR